MIVHIVNVFPSSIDVMSYQCLSGVSVSIFNVHHHISQNIDAIKLAHKYILLLLVLVSVVTY